MYCIKHRSIIFNEDCIMCECTDTCLYSIGKYTNKETNELLYLTEEEEKLFEQK